MIKLLLLTLLSTTIVLVGAVEGDVCDYPDTMCDGEEACVYKFETGQFQCTLGNEAICCDPGAWVSQCYSEAAFSTHFSPCQNSDCSKNGACSDPSSTLCGECCQAAEHDIPWNCPVTVDPEVGGDDCKDLDEAACITNAASCKVKSRNGEFRMCKPKRCKQIESKSDCEAAVHCRPKLGRKESYKRCVKDD